MPSSKFNLCAWSRFYYCWKHYWVIISEGVRISLTCSHLLLPPWCNTPPYVSPILYNHNWSKNAGGFSFYIKINIAHYLIVYVLKYILINYHHLDVGYSSWVWLLIREARICRTLWEGRCDICWTTSLCH